MTHSPRRDLWAAPAAIAFALVTTLATASRAETVAEALPGELFTGFLTVDVVPANGEDFTRYGDAVIEITEPEDGNARLIVTGIVDDGEGEASFFIEGTLGPDGFRSVPASVSLEISPDGVIDGGGESGPQRLAFSGEAAADQIDLVVELTLLEASGGGLPAGSRFIFTYEVSRSTEEDAESSVSGTCDDIRYEMRPVPSFTGHSMSMIQVPICIQE